MKLLARVLRSNLYVFYSTLGGSLGGYPRRPVSVVVNPSGRTSHRNCAIFRPSTHAVVLRVTISLSAREAKNIYQPQPITPLFVDVVSYSSRKKPSTLSTNPESIINMPKRALVAYGVDVDACANW